MILRNIKYHCLRKRFNPVSSKSSITFDTVCNDAKNIRTAQKRLNCVKNSMNILEKRYDIHRRRRILDSGQWTVSGDASDLIRLLNWVFGPIRVQLGAICDFTRGNGVKRFYGGRFPSYPRVVKSTQDTAFQPKIPFLLPVKLSLIS